MNDVTYGDLYRSIVGDLGYLEDIATNVLSEPPEPHHPRIQTALDRMHDAGMLRYVREVWGSCRLRIERAEGVRDDAAAEASAVAKGFHLRDVIA